MWPFVNKRTDAVPPRGARVPTVANGYVARGRKPKKVVMRLADGKKIGRGMHR